ncbi:MAG: GNAT family N-acetyltransferase [Planctomycetes bacterium]|nr:GNAT family N-acetyltransferase [Planctomycetota bacterium]
MSDFVCELLERRHDRRRFNCGVEVLNDYLVRAASQDVKRKAAAVFVLSPQSERSRVAGFYTLCATSIELSQLPPAMIKKLPRYPDVPAILIGRLARDLAFPGVGSLLLADALARCVRVAHEIAATVIVVDSKGATATRFYDRFGFLSLPELPHRMFLPMATAEKAARCD